MFFRFNADFNFLDRTKNSFLAEHVERIRAVTSAVRVLVYVTWPVSEILHITAAAEVKPIRTAAFFLVMGSIRNVK